jgi:hypothetical protein
MIRTIGLRFLTAACLALAASACLADMRSGVLLERTAPADEARGRALLTAAEDALCAGGDCRKRWLAQSAVAVELSDEWYGVARAVNPWPVNPIHVRFVFVPGQDDSYATVLDAGDAPGVQYGIHDWNVWRRDPGKAAVYEDNADMQFMLPTLQYFLELPFRINDAAIVDYGGTTQIGDTQYDVVYATWESYPPNPRVDQYMVYINKATGRAELSAYSVRDMGQFIAGAVQYGDYRQIGDFRLPHDLRLIAAADDPSLVHHIKVAAFRAPAELDRSVLIPDPTRPPKNK